MSTKPATTVRQVTFMPSAFTDDDLYQVVRTHVLYNLAVAHYCREIKRVRAVAVLDGGEGGQTLLALLDGLLASKNPSQEARGWFGPLTNPTSTGKGSKGNPAAVLQAYATLAARPSAYLDPAVRQAAEITGKPAGWMQKLKEGVPEDEVLEDCLKWIKENTTMMGGGPATTLRQQGWLAQGHPGRVRMFHEVSAKKYYASVELYAFCRAFVVLGANAKKRVTRTEDRVKHLAELTKKYAPMQAESWWADVEAYEAERTLYIGRQSGNIPKEPYKVGLGSDLRGWGRVREAWLERRWTGTTPSEDELRDIFNGLRNEAPERFGDAALVEWLAVPAQWRLWDGSHLKEDARASREGDRIGNKGGYNRAETKFKRNIVLTLPDPFKHPLRVDFGASAAGTASLDLDMHTVKLGLPTGNLTFALRPESRIKMVNKSPVLMDGSGAKEGGFPVKLGGVALQMSRKLVSSAPFKQTFAQKYPSPQLVDEMTRTLYDHVRGRDRAFQFCVSAELEVPNTVLSTKDVKFSPPPFFPAYLREEAISKYVGLRVMGVELGMTNLATISAVDLVDKDPGKGAVLVAPNVWAKVSLTRTINLPEDHVPPNLAEAWQRLFVARRVVGYQNRIAKELELAGRERVSADLKPAQVLKLLSDNGVNTAEVEAALGNNKNLFKAWDRLAKATRARVWEMLPAKTKGGGGLSFSHMAFLEDLLKFERKFQMRGRTDEKRDFRGAFHSKLRVKINRMREDRAKKVAGAIARAATDMGAKVIAVESLSRFTASYSRTKAENQQVVQWAHRAVLDRIVMGAQPRGLTVATTYPNYSNQLSAVTGAPGVRATRFKAAWRLPDAPKWQKELALKYPSAVEGDPVVRRHGELLLTVDTPTSRPKVVRTNASVQAAMRFITYDVRPAYLKLAPHKNGLFVATSAIPKWQGCLFSKNGDEYVPTGKRVNLKDKEEEESESTSGSVSILRDITGHVRPGVWVPVKIFWSEVEALLQ